MKWRCPKCTQIFESATPPLRCPHCKVFARARKKWPSKRKTHKQVRALVKLRAQPSFPNEPMKLGEATIKAESVSGPLIAAITINGDKHD